MSWGAWRMMLPDAILPVVSIGERIGRARNALGWTRERLAEEAGVRPEQVSRWESGSRVPKRESVLKLARAMGVTVADLELGSQPPSTPPRGRPTLPDYVRDMEPAALRAMAEMMLALADAKEASGGLVAGKKGN